MFDTRTHNECQHYKVRARNGHDWRAHDIVRMEISVGREYQEGEKLKAAMEWSTERFKRVIVLVADTQQRYNFMFANPLTEDEAFNVASASGDEWVERNVSCLNHPAINVVRWEDVKHYPQYQEAYQTVADLYEHNNRFKGDVDRGIIEHWQRQDHSDGDFQRYFELSKSYALEELAVFSVFYHKEGGISAYPGTLTFTKAMYANKDALDAPAGFQNAHYTCLNFERRKTDYKMAA